MRVLFFVFIISNLLFAQLKEFEIKSQDPPDVMPVLALEGRYAALIIYSSLPDLNFSSNTGGIADQRIDPTGNKYTLIVETERQVIKVKCAGFIEGNISLRKMEPKAVLYYSIEEKMSQLTVQKGTFIFNTTPPGVDYEFIGYLAKGKTPVENSIAAGKYRVKFSKTGYKDTTLVIDIKPGETTQKSIIMTMDLEIIDYGFIVTDIRPTINILKNTYSEPSKEGLQIFYDLEGEADDEFEITIVLKSSTDKEFEYFPKTISGDIGEGKFAGKQRKVVWKAEEEFPAGTSTDDLYLEITADEIGASWWWYIGGAAVIGGGTAAAVLLGGGNGSEPTTPETTIPNPPERP